MRGAVSALAAVLALACVFALNVTAADAATFDVTTTDDEADSGLPTPCDPGDTDCSLREAIIAANATGGLDTVRIPAGAYKITIAKGDGGADNGDFDITNDLTIERSGAGAVVIDGEAVDNVFEISPAATDVTVSDVSVIDGNRNQASGSSANFAEHGGGFRTLGQLTLNRVVVDDNTAFGQGGGIAVLTSGSLIATDTTITGNSAASGGGHLPRRRAARSASTARRCRANETTANGQGGGIAASFGGALTVERSEISENIAGTHGGITFQHAAHAAELDGQRQPGREHVVQRVRRDQPVEVRGDPILIEDSTIANNFRDATAATSDVAGNLGSSAAAATR